MIDIKYTRKRIRRHLSVEDPMNIIGINVSINYWPLTNHELILHRSMYGALYCSKNIS